MIGRFQVSSTPSFNVFTAFYQGDGRKFQEVGNYEHSMLCLEPDGDMFPNVKFRLNGRHLIVTTNYVRNWRQTYNYNTTTDYLMLFYIALLYSRR